MEGTNQSEYAHTAGEKMYENYAGDTLEIVYSMTGKTTAVEAFVTILGASQLIDVEVAMNQREGRLH